MHDATLAARQRKATFGRSGLFFSVIFAMLALVILFATILNQVGGYTVMQNTVDPATLADRPLDQLGPDQLAKIINDNLTSGQVDRLMTNTLASSARAKVRPCPTAFWANSDPSVAMRICLNIETVLLQLPCRRTYRLDALLDLTQPRFIRGKTDAIRDDTLMRQKVGFN